MNVLWADFLAAMQFLTRIPIPSRPQATDALARASGFFPVVGLIVGLAGAGLFLILDTHLPRLVTAGLVVACVALLTGCLHEDGLADAADGFGGGWTKSQTLTIFRDSRIGSYGGIALGLSLLLRVASLASLPRENVFAVLVTAHVLCRWTALPLGYWLPPARESKTGAADGQGARVAHLVPLGALLWGTLFPLVCVCFLMRRHAAAPLIATLVVTALTGLYYRRRIGGVTGDCFGATNQLTEIAVYLCGAWIA